jgi:hypothetical protein
LGVRHCIHLHAPNINPAWPEFGSIARPLITIAIAQDACFSYSMACSTLHTAKTIMASCHGFKFGIMGQFFCS